MKLELERTRAKGMQPGRGIGNIVASHTTLQGLTLARTARGRSAQQAAAAHLHTTRMQATSAVLTAAPQTSSILF